LTTSHFRYVYFLNRGTRQNVFLHLCAVFLLPSPLEVKKGEAWVMFAANSR